MIAKDLVPSSGINSYVIMKFRIYMRVM